MRSVEIILTVSLCMLVGCSTASDPTNVSTESASPTLNTMASWTPIASLTATLTSSPTSTAPATFTPIATAPTLQVTPLFSALEGDFLKLADLIFENHPPECQLPCWQGLENGRSDRRDIQRFFDERMGFNGALDFTDASPLNAEYQIRWIDDVSNLYYTGYSWRFHDYEDRQEEIIILTVVDMGTEKLAGNEIFWAARQHNFTLKRVLTELGPPDWAFAGANSTVNITPELELAIIKLMLIYERGITIYYRFLLGSIDDSERTTTLCFADPDGQPEIPVIGSVYLTSPFMNGLNDLTLLQANAVDQPLLPIKEVFNISEDELYELAISQGNACIEGKMR